MTPTPALGADKATDELPKLPRPLCTYADHSYPAFSKAQMEDYARAALAGAPVQQIKPVAKLMVTRGIFDEQRDTRLTLLAEFPAGTYDLYVRPTPAVEVARLDLAKLQRYENYGNESGGGVQEAPSGEYVVLADVEALFAPDQTTGEKK